MKRAKHTTIEAEDDNTGTSNSIIVIRNHYKKEKKYDINKMADVMMSVKLLWICAIFPIVLYFYRF